MCACVKHIIESRWNLFLFFYDAGHLFAFIYYMIISLSPLSTSAGQCSIYECDIIKHSCNITKGFGPNQFSPLRTITHFITSIQQFYSLSLSFNCAAHKMIILTHTTATKNSKYFIRFFVCKQREKKTPHKSRQTCIFHELNIDENRREWKMENDEKYLEH